MYKNQIAPTWDDNLISQLTFTHRSDYQNNLQFVESLDSNRYDKKIGLHYCNSPYIEQMFELKDHFDFLNEKVYAVHCMVPGAIIPNHRDLYNMYRQKRNIDYDNISTITRVILFLQDWQPGHILQIKNELTPPWKSGQWVSWNGDTDHLAANLGSVNRYTLQITGIRK
jgi:hypothetical protein